MWRERIEHQTLGCGREVQSTITGQANYMPGINILHLILLYEMHKVYKSNVYVIVAPYILAN